ncbi:MAG: motility associated factor glycosyltransferase family protein [Deltaproteobacteria bacterium]|nr:motility associated factor glycosyltransferase family protein [Deltaproteobacteria bacterium]
MNYFEKNFAVLETTHPKLAQKIREIKYVPEQLVEVSPGIFDLKDAQGKLLYQGQPLLKAEEYLKKTNLISPKFVVFYGLGLGYSFQQFCKKFSQKFEAAIVLERSLTLFRYSLELTDWTEILTSQKLLLLVDEELEALQEKLQAFFADGNMLVFIKDMPLIYEEVSLVWDKKEDYYVSVAQCMKEQIEQVSEFMVGDWEDNYQGFMNVVNNVFHAHQVPSFTCLLERFRDFPGIVVSTGPSLNHSLEWLKKVQNKAVIACADSALRILLQHGITPHLVGCLERISCTRKYFEEFNDLRRTFLLSDLSVWPETYQKYSGPKINFFRPLGQQGWFFPKEILRNAGSSVAHELFFVLCYMGCSSVFLVGQDLAYDPYTHAGHAQGASSFQEDCDKKELQHIQQHYVSAGSKEVWVEGNNEKLILSSPIWNSFRFFFESILKKEGVGIHCYNVIPKEYGARLKNAKWLDPDQALEFFSEERDVFALLKESIEQSPVEEKEVFLEKMKMKFRTALGYLRNFQEITLDILDSISIFQHRFDLQLFGLETYRPLLLRLEQTINELENIPENLEDNFFGNFLFPQIQGELIPFYQGIEAALKLPEQSTFRIREQIKMLRTWLKTVHYACARMENFILKNLSEENQTLFES